MTCKLDLCKRDFQPVRKWQQFCTKKCRNTYHNAAKMSSRKALVVLLIPNLLLQLAGATLSYGLV